MTLVGVCESLLGHCILITVFLVHQIHRYTQLRPDLGICGSDSPVRGLRWSASEDVPTLGLPLAQAIFLSISTVDILGQILCVLGTEGCLAAALASPH